MTAKNIMLTPGPTPLPPSVLEAMSRPLIHHRTAEFGRMFVSVIEDMQFVYRTKNSVLMMTASGTGAMESAVINLLSPGDLTIVCTTGAFGDRFVNIHKAFGLKPVVLPFEWGTAVDGEVLRKALKENKGVKAVFLQHTDTSTGVLNDIKGLSKIIHEESDALVVVDSVSGLACEPLETDGWGLDCVTAPQKGWWYSTSRPSRQSLKAVETANCPNSFDFKLIRRCSPTRGRRGRPRSRSWRGRRRR
jgi:aspartate aminotransferase-like enzyme